MKKPVQNKPDPIVDKHGTRWYLTASKRYWFAYDNFQEFYIAARMADNPPVPLTGIWDQ